MRYIFAALIFVLSLTLGGQSVAIEKPDYTVVMSEGKFEIRDYPEMLLAEVKVTGDRDQAANRGFRKLAAFIFGDNQPNAKIAMTSPVTQTPQETVEPKSESIAMTAPVMQTSDQNGQWVVNFMMPSEYSMETLPRPTDDEIRIFKTEPYCTVSIRFSGRGTMKNLKKQRSRLDRFVKEQGLVVSGLPEYAFYNPPIVPPMFRRNEVHYRVAVPSN
ncbi:SOUL family heme-binding protein [Hellea balneolensis]|uniref:SOUL family heme-binding protein n=1 Tax=Hellea balneolensis TaxID=287478 RepID=UPI00041A766E|nr:heme-binding protein [Hellea balneolensis]